MSDPNDPDTDTGIEMSPTFARYHLARYPIDVRPHYDPSTTFRRSEMDILHRDDIHGRDSVSVVRGGGILSAVPAAPAELVGSQVVASAEEVRIIAPISSKSVTASAGCGPSENQITPAMNQTVSSEDQGAVAENLASPSLNQAVSLQGEAVSSGRPATSVVDQAMHAELHIVPAQRRVIPNGTQTAHTQHHALPSKNQAKLALLERISPSARQNAQTCLSIHAAHLQKRPIQTNPEQHLETVNQPQQRATTPQQSNQIDFEQRSAAAQIRTRGANTRHQPPATPGQNHATGNGLLQRVDSPNHDNQTSIEQRAAAIRAQTKALNSHRAPVNLRTFGPAPVAPSANLERQQARLHSQYGFARAQSQARRDNAHERPIPKTPEPRPAATQDLTANQTQAQPANAQRQRAPVTPEQHFVPAHEPVQTAPARRQPTLMSPIQLRRDRPQPNAQQVLANMHPDMRLQAFLYRQQLLAGIPPDQLIPMRSPGNQGGRGTQRHGPPTLLQIRNDTITAPRIPPARFNGVMHPFPRIQNQPANQPVTQTTFRGIRMAPRREIQLAASPESLRGRRYRGRTTATVRARRTSPVDIAPRPLRPSQSDLYPDSGVDGPHVGDNGPIPIPVRSAMAPSGLRNSHAHDTHQQQDFNRIYEPTGGHDQDQGHAGTNGYMAPYIEGTDDGANPATNRTGTQLTGTVTNQRASLPQAAGGVQNSNGTADGRTNLHDIIARARDVASSADWQNAVPSLPVDLSFASTVATSVMTEFRSENGNEDIGGQDITASVEDEAAESMVLDGQENEACVQAITSHVQDEAAESMALDDDNNDTSVRDITTLAQEQGISSNNQNVDPVNMVETASFTSTVATSVMTELLLEDHNQDEGGEPATGNLFDIPTALTMNPELFFKVADDISVRDLVNLFRTSMHLNGTITVHLEDLIKRQASIKAPGAARIFPFTCYPQLCTTKTIAGETRLIPTFKWLSMICIRDTMIKDILAILRTQDPSLPKTCEATVRKLWFLVDLSDNERRTATIRNKQIWNNDDIFLAGVFLKALDKRFASRRIGFNNDGIRRLLMAQPSLMPMWRAVRSEALNTKFDTLKAFIRWKYDLLPHEEGKTVYGVRSEEIGLIQYEGYGRSGSRVILCAPDELVFEEGYRRKIDIPEAYREARAKALNGDDYQGDMENEKDEGVWGSEFENEVVMLGESQLGKMDVD